MDSYGRLWLIILLYEVFCHALIYQGAHIRDFFPSHEVHSSHTIRIPSSLQGQGNAFVPLHMSDSTCGGLVDLQR